MEAERIYPSQSTKCSNVSEFLDNVRSLRERWKKFGLPRHSSRKKLPGEEKALWFRGQSDCKWGLQPTLWREQYQRANEAEMRLEFKSVGDAFAASGRNQDDWCWYFLMQHYGVPTRLLDWATNPLVALYFAVRHPKENDAAVWVLDPWRWNRAHVKGLYGPAMPGWKETGAYLLDLEDAFDAEHNEHQTRKRWPVTIEPPHVDRRIAAQGSKFVLFGTRRDMLDSPAINRRREDKSGKHAILDRMTIPREHSEKILSELNSLGLNERALFPDLDGLGKHIAWEWKSATKGVSGGGTPKRRRAPLTDEPQPVAKAANA